jgi:hypothetical protein
MVESLDDILFAHLIDFGEFLEFNNYFVGFHLIVLKELLRSHFER